MEWIELQYFLAVAKEQNISKASEQVYISQSALSQAVKRLEEELGYPLFHRNGKRIYLNDSGKVFMRTIEEMNRLMDNTKMQLEEMNQLSHPNVTINLTTASQQLPTLLSHLKKADPKVQYNIQQHTDPIHSDQADINIVSISQSDIVSFMSDMDNSGKTDQLLLKEDTVLALPQNHPLLTNEHLYMKDLLEEDII